MSFDIPITSEKRGGRHVYNKHQTKRPLPQPADPVGVKPDVNPLSSMSESEKLTVIDNYSSQITDLQAERDQLRKEVEGLKERVKDESEMCVSHHNQITSLLHERDSALAKLASFQWKPVSTPPTFEDAVEVPDGRGRPIYAVRWCFGTVTGRCAAIGLWNEPIKGSTHWQRLSPLPPVPAETEEQKMRREFEDHCAKRFPNGITLTMKEEFWATWQAALASRNGKEES